MISQPGDREDAWGLLVDYGGVLTSSVGRSFRAFEREEGLPKGTVFEVVADAYSSTDGAIARYERGEISADEFARTLADEFAARGHDVEAAGIHARMFERVAHEQAFWDVVVRARCAGVRTGLVSNSWGRAGYPQELLDRHFDAIVISGEVGVRKPDPEIFRLALDRLGVRRDRTAFVDDLEHNVAAARDFGLFAVHYADHEAAVEQLESFFGTDLAV